MASKRRIEEAEQMIRDVENKIQEEFEELKLSFQDLKYKRFEISMTKSFFRLISPCLT